MQTWHKTAFDVSIIIPVYNGSLLLERHLTPFLAWMSESPYKTQIILVDDGSADRDITAAYATKQGLFFIGLDANKGKGAALRKGFEIASGNIQLFTDADIPFQYHNIAAFISLLQRHPQSLIIGDRTDPTSTYFEKTSFLRNCGSLIVSALVKFFFVQDIKDTQCGLKGMGKETAVRLFNNSQIDRFAIDIELIYLACKNNIPVIKAPVQLRYNDISTLNVVKDGLKLLSDIYRIRKIHGRKICK